ARCAWVFLAHGRPALVHMNVTANPTAAWVWRQVIEATPWGHKPRHLLRDRDAVYGRDFRARAERIGIDAIATPIASPRANAVIERVIGTLRRECLDQLIILDEQHLRSVLTEFVGYYNLERPHRTLRLETPVPVLRAGKGQCDHDQCSAGYITCTSEQPDHPQTFAPSQLDCWLSRTRDLAAAEAFFRRTIRSTGCTSEHVVTDKAAFYPSAIRTCAPDAKHTAT